MFMLENQKPANMPSVKTYNYPDGSTSTVRYNQQGLLVEINIEGGSWKRKEAGGWGFYDAKSREQDQLDGELEVNWRGDIIARRHDGYSEIQFADGTFQIIYPDKTKETHYPDGYSLVERADGSRVYRSKEGLETEIKSQVPEAADKVVPVRTQRPFKITDLNKKIGKIVDFGSQPKKSDWYAIPKADANGNWFENKNGDKLKQEEDGSSTVYHKDGSYEQIDKNGKIRLNLGDEWLKLD